jgi:predicted nucleotidyltransferase
MSGAIKADAALENSLQLVRRFVVQRHPTAEAALLAGSRARGSAAPTSDHDVVLLFASLPDGAWREMVLFEESHIETFAQDLGTFGYFCREFDRLTGKPVLPAMVAEGIAVLGEDSALLGAAREIATETLRLGPPPLDAEAISRRRYVITDLAVKLRPDIPPGVLLAAGAALYVDLADFAFRSEGHWSAQGKAIPRALEAIRPGLAEQFETAFGNLFAKHDVAPVQALVDAVLQPHGGRLREGYRQTAPANWTDTPPGSTSS